VIAEEVRQFLADAGLIVVSVAAIFGVGRWFGGQHSKVIAGIAGVKQALDTHIADEAVAFERIETRIEKIETAINGKS
jgi:hypothetical protein